jgi:peptidylprolyl isomerase
MSLRPLLAASAALLLSGQAPPPTPSSVISDPGAVIATAPDADWRAVDIDNIIVFETARGRMVLELAPDFAPMHIKAIRDLVARGRFDDGAITRVQDNYVIQWAARPASEGTPAPEPLPPEYERSTDGLIFTPLGFPDAYGEAGFVNSWPTARDRKRKAMWLAHCYGMVGVGREAPPDVGDGSELYAIIGHAPRHLDRNLAVVGRILEGLDAHASLPRGKGALGVYETEAERTPIIRAMLGANLPEPPRFEVMDTASPSFVRYRVARANRTGFFVTPAGGLDLCNLPVPVRRVAPGASRIR